MTILYCGNRSNYNPYTGKTNRNAAIYFDINNKVDCQVTQYVIKALEINGWPHSYDFAGEIDIEVDNREDYNRLLQLYKSVKKEARRFAKFFPQTSYLYNPE